MSLVPKHTSFDDVFDNFLAVRENTGLKSDIYEKDGMYHIEVDAPGFNKDDIKIDLNDGYVTITANKQTANDEEGKNYIRKERHATQFSRQFYLGNIDEDTIKAKFENGCLNIEVAKRDKPEKKKIIVIE